MPGNGQEAELLGDPWTHTGYVFTYETGEPLKPQYATRLFEKLRRPAGLPKITFNGQRHESASLLLANGAVVALVSKMLGHTSVSITSDLYSHLIGGVHREASQRAAASIPRPADAHRLHTEQA